MSWISPTCSVLIQSDSHHLLSIPHLGIAKKKVENLGVPPSPSKLHRQPFTWKVGSLVLKINVSKMFVLEWPFGLQWKVGSLFSGGGNSNSCFAPWFYSAAHLVCPVTNGYKWQLKYVFNLHPYLGKWSQFDPNLRSIFFSNGLKPPTRLGCLVQWGFHPKMFLLCKTWWRIFCWKKNHSGNWDSSREKGTTKKNTNLPTIHPGRSTWNLKMVVWKMIFLFQGCILRFHVNFWGVSC